MRKEWEGYVYACSRNAAMLWAATCLAFFEFMWIGELVAPGVAQFNPAVHLCYGDVCVDRELAPSCLKIHVKAFKTDPFHKGSVSTWDWYLPCSIYRQLYGIVWTSSSASVCASRGAFLDLTEFVQAVVQALEPKGILSTIIPDIASGLVLQLWLLSGVYLMH